MNNDKPASESSPTDTQNYICLNCKLVLNHEPKQCPECKHQFFHKTDASPTEHPGDAKHTWKVGGTNEDYGNLRQYSTAVFDDIECVGRSMAFTYEESRQRAELIARAPALLSEVSTLRSNQAELVAENERRLQAIGKMLTALNECGREIHWNTSNEIEEAYAEMRAIYKSALSGGSK